MENPEQTKKGLRQTIQSIAMDRDSIPHTKTGHLLFGLSGAGKSTLVHYLSKNQKLKIKQDGFNCIYYVDESQINQLSTIKVSAKAESETIMPNCITCNGITFKDLPGFNDNRYLNHQLFNQQFLNAFYLKQTFLKTDQSKMLLVINVNDIQGRDNSFSNLLKTFFSMFNNLEEIKDSFMLIITHATHKVNIKNAKDKITQIIKSSTIIDQKYKNTFKYILENQRISIFYEPTTQIVDFKQSDEILNKLNQLRWKSIKDINITLSDKTKQLLVQISGESQVIMNQINQSVRKMIQNILQYLFTQQNYPQMKRKLLQIHNFITGMDHKTKKQEFFDFFNKIIPNPEELNNVLEKLKNQFDFLDFLQDIIKNKKACFYSFEDMKEKLSQSTVFNLTDSTSLFIFENMYVALVIKRDCFTANNIQQLTKQYFQIVDQFIFNAKSIILNQNITVPGKNLMFVADQIVADQQKNITIRLKGKNGSHHKYNAIDKDGSVGLNGQNGGNLQLHFKEYKGRAISADLRGGDGGRGQDCQISTYKMSEYVSMMKTDYKQQKDQHKCFMTKRQNYGFTDKQGVQKFTHAVKLLTTFNGQVLQTYNNNSTKAWKKYYKLQPGAGGNPGLSGLVHIHQNGVQYDQSQIQNICQVNPKLLVSKGQNGQIIFDQYQGKYVRQLFFSALRQQGKSVDEQTVAGSLCESAILSTVAVAGGVIAQQAAQQTAKVIVKQALKSGSKQVIKQAGIQAAETVGTAGLIGGFLSFGIGLAVQGIISPISAALSDGWKEQVKSLNRKCKMDVSKFNKKYEAAKNPIKLSQQNINFVLKKLIC